MDKLTKNILQLLQDNARLSNEQIAELLNEPVDKVAGIIEELEQSGIIMKYTAIVNHDFAGSDFVDALIEVKVTPQKRSGFDAIAEEIMSFDMVKNLYLMSGSNDLTLTIEGKTVRDISLFVSEMLSTIDCVTSTRTQFILKQYMNGGVRINNANADKRELVR